MTADLSDDDRGKSLVSRNQRLGVVTDIRGDTVHLDLDFDNIPDGLREELGWDPSNDTNTVDASAIEATRNDQVVLRDDLYSQ